MSHNTPEQNAAFREAWEATNARWKAGDKVSENAESKNDVGDKITQGKILVKPLSQVDAPTQERTVNRKMGR